MQYHGLNFTRFKKRQTFFLLEKNHHAVTSVPGGVSGLHWRDEEDEEDVGRLWWSSGSCLRRLLWGGEEVWCSRRGGVGRRSVVEEAG